MTDTTASLDALGLEPVAWLYHDESQRLLGFRRDYFASAEGLIETPLYSATDLAPLARRVEELEAALRKIAAECCVPVGADKQMYARWRRLAADRVDIARAALKENTDATSD